jgi:uncharacterized protein (DUF433 family)
MMRWHERVERAVTESRNYDWTHCVLVESVPGKLSGTPVIVGTRVPVQTIVDNYDSGMEPREIAEQWRLKLSDVTTVLEYREDLYARLGR